MRRLGDCGTVHVKKPKDKNVLGAWPIVLTYDSYTLSIHKIPTTVVALL